MCTGKPSPRPAPVPQVPWTPSATSRRSHHDRTNRTGVVMKAVTDATFTDDVLQSDKPVLVDFWAEWCGPCRKVNPLLEELSKEMGDRVEIVKLDIDANPQVTLE